jgi:hypothetical protein
VAVFTFDLHDSDLPLQVTFPVLMANLLNFLTPGQAFAAGDGLRPGQPLALKPRGGEGPITVEDPTGQRFAPSLTEAGLSFADTHRLGLYTVRSGERVLGQFAVNLFDPAESAIRPAEAIRIGRSEVSAAGRQAQGQLEIWPWLAAAAFALLLGEWWVYHRGATLPALPGWRGALVRKKA